MKANGREVNSQRDFYDALQQNSAFCKLEVLDLQGELRFAQSSIFQGDHYQIGCLFVPDDKMGNLSFRGLRSSVVIHRDRTDVENEQNGLEADKLPLELEREVETISELKPTFSSEVKQGKTDTADHQSQDDNDLDWKEESQQELAASEDSNEQQDGVHEGDDLR